jgi:hypothetical protein
MLRSKTIPNNYQAPPEFIRPETDEKGNQVAWYRADHPNWLWLAAAC